MLAQPGALAQRSDVEAASPIFDSQPQLRTQALQLQVRIGRLRMLAYIGERLLATLKITVSIAGGSRSSSIVCR